jgi:2-dehydropantoate 2-reductase
MRFIMYGAGGIGGTIGARLFLQGQEVLLIARGAHLKAIQEQGLFFISPEGEQRLAIPCVGSPEDHLWREGDVVLLCVKSQHTSQALEALRRVAGDKIPVLCVQNGVANEELALRLFSWVYAVHVFLPASHLVPGVVVTYGHQPGGVLDIGRYPSGADDLCTKVAVAFQGAGFGAQVEPLVMRYKYSKLLSNLHNVLQAAILLDDSPQVISSMLQAEARACYQAAGIDWATDDESARRREAGLRYGEVPGHPRPGGSSWQSIARRTGDIEVDYLNGEIVRLGRRFGVKTPVNLVLQRVGNEMAWKVLLPGSFDAAVLLSLIEVERLSCSGYPRSFA